MKIFYGVQGTGNGHITRARVMAKALYAAGMDVTFQFTGRPADKYFDMEIFNSYQTRQGLTFSFDKGKINYHKTVLNANLGQFVKDINSLDLHDYDLVITDFEPVTAWAAKKQKKFTLGIGHQYSFRHKVPRQGHDPIAEQVLKHFAPANKSIGFHWHHFNQPIFPPMIDTTEKSVPKINNKIMVYLPFENQHQVINLLTPFTNYHFHIYSPESVHSEFDHLHCYPLSRDGFQQNLSDCAGIITNSGFELASECLQLGKKILAKPIHGQMEQLANAAALTQLGYGQVMNQLEPKAVAQWLQDEQVVHVSYPDVANIIVHWIQDGMPDMNKDFIASIWDTVQVRRISN
jgi:uncharacterized protein (TIGR00661 family)